MTVPSPVDAALGQWSRLGAPAIDAAILIGLAIIPFGLVTGRPELVALGAPLFVAAAISLVDAAEPDLAVSLRLSARRVLEGSEASAVLHLSGSEHATVIVDYTLQDPSGVHRGRAGAAVEPNRVTVVEIPLDATRWGAQEISLDDVTVERRFGLVRHRSRGVAVSRLKVLPSAATVQTLVAPSRTRPVLGNLPSRHVGGGLEFSGTRPYRTGDDHRWINWRASARRGETWVNEFHVERSADVVIFVDGFRDANVGGSTADSTLVLAVRLADAVAAGYLREHARVGAVSYGSQVRWLRLGMGRRQAFQILETFVDAEASQRTRQYRSSAIPPRQIPREALVIVLTPLLDHRILAAVGHLRSRDQDVVVVDLGSSLDEQATAATGVPGLDARLLVLARRDARNRLAAMGVPVGSWDATLPVDAALTAINRWRGRSVQRR